jgi:hypothetical protein
MNDAPVYVAPKVDGEALQGLTMFNGWVDQIFCQGGNSKRDIKMTENTTMENLTKEIVAAMSNSAKQEWRVQRCLPWDQVPQSRETRC